MAGDGIERPARTEEIHVQTEQTQTSRNVSIIRQSRKSKSEIEVIQQTPTTAGDPATSNIQSINNNKSDSDIRRDHVIRRRLRHQHKHNSLLILYANLRSILNKHNETNSAIHFHKPDIALFCETWTNDEISNGMLNIDGYDILKRLDRSDTANGFGGGLLIYIKQGIDVSPMEDDIYKLQQSASFTSGDTTFVLAYRPHRLYNNESTENNNAMLIDMIQNLPKPWIALGDFNYGDIKWPELTGKPVSSAFREALESNFVTQHVNFPTHTAGNILDLVLSSGPGLIESCDDVGPIANSDHNAILIKTTGEKSQDRNNNPSWKWSKANIINIKKGLIDWTGSFMNDARLLTVNDLWKSFKCKIHQLMEDNIPKWSKPMKDKPPWYSQEIVRLYRRRDRLWKAYRTHLDLTKKQEHAMLTKHIKKAVRQARRRYEKNLATDSNDKKFYKYLKAKRENRVEIGPLKVGDKSTSDPNEMSNILNEYFASVFSRECSPPLEITQLEQNYIKDDIEILQHIRIDDSKILKVIDKIKQFTENSHEF